MRKLLYCFFLAAFSLFISATVASAFDYIAVYADEYHCDYCCYTFSAYQQVDVWVWALPGENGNKGVTFALEYPPNVINELGALNEPPLTPFENNYCDGNICNYSFGYNGCAFDWYWLVHASIIVLDSEPGVVRIVPHQDLGKLCFITCEEDYTEVNARILTNLYLNPVDCPEISVESTSWSAIKSMYR